METDKIAGLTVEELEKLLKKMPRKAFIAIGEDIVTGIVLETGKVKEGYYNSHFQKNPKGKIMAVRFTKHTEFSDGAVDLTTV